ncbi:MAG: hypothetical protein FIA95_08255 [Gemmatimonadetes bacterium]|nr:hypothetical protein [Gemmatimonadota bacterium]
MLSLVFYKTVHFLGVFALITALAASLARAALAATTAGVAPAAAPWGKRLGILHGVALFLVLLGGFGMLARLGMSVTGWVGAKLLIWIAVGGLIALRKNPTAAAWGLMLLPILATLAGWIGYTKPF